MSAEEKSANKGNEGIEKLLRRINRELNGANERQMRLLEKLEALETTDRPSPSADLNPTVVQELKDAISAMTLPPAVNTEDNNELESSEVAKLRDEITSIRSEVSTFLQGISTAVDRLGDMHREALTSCEGISKRQEATLRSQRMRIVDLRRQQDEAIFELERDHQQHLRAHSQRVKKASRRQNFLVAGTLAAMIACVISIANMSAGYQPNSSWSGSPAQVMENRIAGQESPESQPDLPDPESVVSSEDGAQPKG